jgi:prephenate dehydrogenase
VRAFWEALGSHVITMSPAEHDRIIARTSHLPHIVAAALVRSVLREELGQAARMCGTGFMDTTRIAAGSELMWHDIIKTNSNTISRELASFEKEIGTLREMIDRGDFSGIRAFLSDSRSRRRRVGGSPA